MSRGPGKIQQAILQAIQTSTEPIQRNRLLWEIAAKTGQIRITGQLTQTINTGKIGDSFLKSYQRAIKTLSDSEKIVIDKKKFGDIDEFIKYYPFKTTSLEIMSLRRELLPLTKGFLEKAFSTTFTISDNEIFILKNMKQKYPLRFSKYVSRWRKIEKQILLALPTPKQRETDMWVSLITKGRQLFLDRRITNMKAFHTIINEIQEIREQLDEKQAGLIKEATVFQRKALKPKMMEHSRLKSQLYAVAYFGKRATPRLTEDMKQYLLKQRPEIIEVLPEHQKTKKQGYYRFPEKFDPILDKLIHRNVFSRFEFLTN